MTTVFRLRAVAAALVVLLVVLAPAAPAHAGFRTTAWSFDTRTVPARRAELEAWITQQYIGPDGAASTTSLLLAPVLGITDQIELAIPVTADFSRATGQTQLSQYGLDARWRLVTADPTNAPPIVPLLRATARKIIGNDDLYKLQATLAVSYEPTPRLHLVANASIYTVTDLGRGARDQVAAEYSGGALYAVTGDVRVGVDSFAVQQIRGPGPQSSWVGAGPALTLSHGRFWVTASVPIGITENAPDAMPRIIWAIAF
jgi:hypothetical protein